MRNALAFVDSAEFPGRNLASAGKNCAGAEVLDEDEIDKTEGDYGMFLIIGSNGNVGVILGRKDQ